MVCGPLLIVRETADWVLVQCLGKSQHYDQRPASCHAGNCRRDHDLSGPDWYWNPDSTWLNGLRPTACAGTANGALMHCLDSTQGYDLRPAYFMLETEDVVVTCQTLTD